MTHAQGSWQDDRYDEPAAVQAWSHFGARHFAHYCRLARTQSFYLWGRIDDAAAALHDAKQLAAESKGMLHSAEQLFVEVLVGAAQHERLSTLERAYARIALGRAVSKLQGWAKRCPQNFSHKAALARAELDRIAGRERAALTGYLEAVNAADQHGYVHVAALSHLLAARLYARQGNEAERTSRLERARQSVDRWGATALSRHPDLIELQR